MRYRDLVPDRLGGTLAASHIRIETGGPVSDYVHFHEVRFQLIYCRAGWVRVVYEDQGEPFVLAAGDCVLQPPRIRHRVLASSPGCEVIEVSSPAGHETRVDHELALPTPALRRERDFGGQRFARHERASASWKPWRGGFEACDLGIASATNGLASALVARVFGHPEVGQDARTAEALFVFVLKGSARLTRPDARDEALAEGDAFVLPAGMRHGFRGCSRDLELLEVALPA
jgi:quercetin dioxygenase-like cupin family protein